MRITNRMMTIKYTRNLNAISYDLNKLNTKVVTGRKFMTASENPAAAVKAFQIRRDLSKVEGYQTNIQHAKSSLTNSESALMHMQEMIKEVTGKTITALNGSQSDGDRKIIATELRHMQEQLLQSLNSNASGSYYFGGSNTEQKPFELDAGGNLMYNGQVLDNLLHPKGPGFDPNDPGLLKLTQDSQYVDIGLGIKFDSSDQIDRRTVFEYSVPGINIVGYGKTTLSYEKDGVNVPTSVSDNLYNILGELAAEFEKPAHHVDPNQAYSHGRADALFGHFQSNSSKILTSITDIGAKTSYLQFMNDRYESNTLDMQERQMDVEAAEPAETIIQFESQKVAYNAALKMGAQIIQPSIFDFMR